MEKILTHADSLDKLIEIYNDLHEHDKTIIESYFPKFENDESVLMYLRGVVSTSVQAVLAVPLLMQSKFLILFIAPLLGAALSKLSEEGLTALKKSSNILSSGDDTDEFDVFERLLSSKLLSTAH